MGFFDEIEGRRGETLACSLLKQLIMRSATIRDEMVDILSDCSPNGPVTAYSHFSCSLEIPTEAEEFGTGRIDLVVEVDQAVVGVEAKLNAGFGPNQPAKYVAQLEATGAGLSAVRGHPVDWFILLLGPKRRVPELQTMADTGKKVVVLSWESIMDRFAARSQEIDPGLRFILHEFRYYLSSQIAFLPSLQRDMPHLLGTWQPGGTPLQREFVRQVAQFFPGSSGRLSAGETWVGYYFSPEQDEPKTGWFGFLPRSRAEGNAASGSALCISAAFDAKPDPGFVIPLTGIHPKVHFGRRESFSWEVKPDASWSSPNQWRRIVGQFCKTAPT